MEWREWTTKDAERLLIRISRMSGVSESTLYVAYDDLHRRHPEIPAWPVFVKLLEESDFDLLHSED